MCLDMAGKVHHIIKGHGVEFVGGKHARSAVEVRIAAGESCAVGPHVAQGRMIDDALGDTAVESSRHDGQRTTLAAALHHQVATVPLGQRGEHV